MLVSGSFLRASIGFFYLLSISVSTALTYFFYSEPVLFAFVLTAVSLLVLSYPVLCLFNLSHSYDLQVRTPFHVEWIPICVDLEAQKISQKVLDEKPSKLDLAFAHAYM
ncbi:unnamed protein product [Caenorhabditis sp. 36 PRJEB53466]|nr:unnamed protein product [Caenorhabditis sp. 36 PRJEB53466]